MTKKRKGTMSMTVDVEIDVDEVLEDLSTKELIEEVHSRPDGKGIEFALQPEDLTELRHAVEDRDWGKVEAVLRQHDVFVMPARLAAFPATMGAA